MKKKFFLMLTLFFLGVAGLKAQVTIGANRIATTGAVLDLEGSQGGFALPKVTNLESNTFVPPAWGTDISLPAGLMVYNEGTGTGLEAGIYVWGGTKWSLVTSTAPPVEPKPLEAFTLSPTSLTFTIGSDDQMVTVASWTPSNADTREVSWKIETGGSGNASIATSYATYSTISAGTITGTNTLTATANPSSGSASPQSLKIFTIPAGTTLLPRGVFTKPAEDYTDAPGSMSWGSGHGTLLVSNTNFSKSRGEVALDACDSEVGIGWRLPNAGELHNLWRSKTLLESISGFEAFESDFYWSSSYADATSLWVWDMGNGIPESKEELYTEGYHFRCVYTLE